jgi:hypothetical protein
VSGGAGREPMMPDSLGPARLGFKKHESRNSKGFVARIDGEGDGYPIGLPSNAMSEPPCGPCAVGEAGRRIRPEHRGPVGSVAASCKLFTGNASPLVSGAPCWDTSGALAQPCAAADAWIDVRFPKASCPARLFLF